VGPDSARSQINADAEVLGSWRGDMNVGIYPSRWGYFGIFLSKQYTLGSGELTLMSNRRNGLWLDFTPNGIADSENHKSRWYMSNNSSYYNKSFSVSDSLILNRLHLQNPSTSSHRKSWAEICFTSVDSNTHHSIIPCLAKVRDMENNR